MIFETKSLVKEFGGVRAINDVSFTISKGKIFGIIGPNGAGKTTLFSIICGFMRPTKGKIIFDNLDITGQTPSDISRKGIVRTFQQTNIFSKLTVLENVICGSFLSTKRDLYNAFFRTKRYREKENEIMVESKNILTEFGFEDKLNEVGKNLSYGDQKKLGLCIALATNPKILLLDEPVAGLTSVEKLSIGNSIRSIKKNRDITVVLVEHDMNFVMKLCDHIIVLNYGEKVVEGSPGEIQSNEEVAAIYLGRKH